MALNSNALGKLQTLLADNPATYNAVVNAAAKSPYFADLLNKYWEANNSNLDFTKGAQTGSWSNISADGTFITIDSTLKGMPQAFISTLAHELSHMVLAGGYTASAASSVAQAELNGKTEEGVALAGQFIVMKQLGWSMPGETSLTSKGITSILNGQSSGVDFSALQLDSAWSKLFTSSTSGAVGAAGAWQAFQKTSIAPLLAYTELWRYNTIVSICTNTGAGASQLSGSVDWSKVESGSIKETYAGDGTCSYDGSNIPLLNGGTANFTGHKSSSGAVNYTVAFRNTDGSTTTISTDASGKEIISNDVNGDKKVDNVVIYGQSYDLRNTQDATRVEGFWNSLGRVASDLWNSITNSIATFLSSVSTFVSSVFSPPSLSLDHIGAFYEVKSAGLDNSVSIANKTGVLLNAQKQGLTTAALTALDANKDGKLTGTELSGLQVWFDTNQNGIQDAGEVQSLTQAGINQIRSSDYSFYTSGNAVATTGPLLTPIAAAMAAIPTSINRIQAAPASNFRSLRDTDNLYWINSSQYIAFGANQVKINNSNRTYLIGTDGNDSFDANYYAAYGAYFNNNLLVNFLAGGGDDVMGGSVRNDNLWGGTGNDTLFGYAGDDKLYGEEGNDELQGGVGNDYLDGGVGNDKLFGQVGDDTLVGGDGDDVLVGFTASNDAKQTLAAGETDDDTLYGGAGNDQIYGGLGNDYLDGGDGNDLVNGGDGTDTLFGGTGDDELDGGAGNDSVSGDAGADKIFGGVGNDQIWGGDGNDILVGFTASNDAKQTLNAGETDDDIIDGGAGDDLILGGLGNDQLFGGLGNDELNGGVGNDQLYGNDGNDRLFGGAGNDIIYGGAGDDLIVGGVATNETALAAGTADSNWLYGGEGNDTIVGGIGNDTIDGGLGADNMQGGLGDDTYIVNSVNDVILEYANQGYDTVISSSNYILNANIEELRLVEGFNINGTGNSLNNRIIGNSADNILDGVTGADTMIGGQGNDTYYVDNVGDQIIEYAGEGTDNVQSKISYTLGDNIENLNLLDFSKPEKGLVDGTNVLVYGYPKANELDYMQGDAVAGYKGTCALTSIANLMTQANTPTTEAQVVNLAIQNNWAVTSSSVTDYQRGGSNYIGQQAILNSYGIANTLLVGYNPEAIANLIQSGRGVILGLNAGKLWNDANYTDAGGVNHVVTITGAVRNASTGTLMGFYIADSGRQQVSDMTRYLSLADFQAAANVANAYAIFTTQALKLWNEDINGTGNSLDNTIIGNRGNNVLNGGYGNDTLNGGAGDDVLDGMAATPVQRVLVTGGAGAYTVKYMVNGNLANAVTSATPIVNAGHVGDSLVVTGSSIADKVYVGAGTIVNAVNLLVGVDEIYFTGASSDYRLSLTTTSGAIVLTRISGLPAGATEVVTVQNGSVMAGRDRLIFTNGSITTDALRAATMGGTSPVLDASIKTNLSDAGFSVLSQGADTLIGGSGNDTYVVDDAGDIVTENLNEGTDTVQSYLADTTLTANVENLTLMGYSNANGTGNKLDNTIIGNRGNNVLNGGYGNDTLNGGAGDDVLDSMNGQVMRVSLAGGPGSYTERIFVGSTEIAPTLTNTQESIVQAGRLGNNYVVRGSGYVDKVYVGAGTTVDAASLGSGVDEVYLTGASSDYSMALLGSTVMMTRVNGLPSGQAEIVKMALADRVIFTDGSALASDIKTALTNSIAFTLDTTRKADINAAGFSVQSMGADTLIGGTGNDTYVVDDAGDIVTENLNEGTDTVQSYLADTTLTANVENLTLMGYSNANGTGNKLDNTIIGNRGNNVLFGAAGTDTLVGGQGNDTYLMQRGQGNDIIVDTDTTIGNNDIISLASDISSSQLWFSHVGNDLKINVIGTSDSYTVKDWYSGVSNQVERIKAANGKVLSNTNVEKLVQAMSSLSAPVAGTTSLPTNYQTTLNPVIAANWQ